VKTFVRRLRPQEGFQSFLSHLLPYWFAASVVALVSVLYSKLFSLSENLFFEWSSAWPWMIFIAAPLVMLGSSALTMRYSPEASGSGIPQLIAALELANEPTPFLEKLLGFPMMIVKFLGSCLCVLGGGVVGREGPNLQISAGIFYQIQKWWPQVATRLSLPSMILAGGAAGLASAFNTPLGGIVFAIEELAKVHLSFIRTSIFHAVVIAGLLAQAGLGNYLYLEKITVAGTSLLPMLPLSIAALLIGSAGALMGALLVTSLKWRAQQNLKTKLLMTFGCGIAVALMFFFVGHGAGGAGRHLILELLTNSKEAAPWYLGFARFGGNFFTYIGGVVGGVFAPSLATGAALGSWMSQFFEGSNHQLWILVGMVSFLTGVTRSPFTSMVLVLEMTDSHAAIIALMMAAILAQGASKLIDPISFYEHMSHEMLKAHPVQAPAAGVES